MKAMKNTDCLIITGMIEAEGWLDYQRKVYEGGGIAPTCTSEGHPAKIIEYESNSAEGEK